MKTFLAANLWSFFEKTEKRVFIIENSICAHTVRPGKYLRRRLNSFGQPFPMLLFVLERPGNPNRAKFQAKVVGQECS